VSPYIKTDENKYFNHDEFSQQQYDPWNIFKGFRPNYSNDSKPPKKSKPDNYSNIPPRQQPPSKEPDYNYQPPRQREENNYEYNPWNVFPGLRPTPRDYKRPTQKRPDKGDPKDPSLKYIPTPVIKDSIGKVINTYIPGYGRVNVYVKGINRNGMVHLVIIEPQPDDYIYIHHSDMVGIYPPTL
jgi:hypothetical protein